MKTANSSTQKVLIGGDLCPIGRSMPLFEAGKAQAFFNDLLPEFEKADFSVVNLECPLIRKKTPIVKIGPTLDASETCINGIKAAGINLVGLANNHIMDHGKAGLEKAQHNIGEDKRIKAVSADTGYYSESNVEYAKEKRIDAYIATE